MTTNATHETLDPRLAARLRAMPKAELHVHVEGTLDPETSWTIAQRNGIALPADSLEAWRAFFAFRDFGHFLEVYVAAASALRTVEDYALMIEHFYAHQARQNVRYCEAFLSGSLALATVGAEGLLEAIARGAERGEAATGVRAAFIPDISRELPHTQAAVTDLVIAGAARGAVIGLGIGGPEQGFPPALFVASFARARAAGLRVVAHAGETAGPDSVRDAVELLGAQRIGHGVRTLEDDALTARLAARALPFEVSPTSNYALGIVAPGEPHPIRRMLAAGLRCTLNSDDPAMFGTDLCNEYALLARQGFSWDELWALNRATLEASFLSAGELARYRAEWDAFAAGLEPLA
ncbi:MAG TPA: adenosine deaminase [Candidatus Sulfotelmatobacter sp.]|nr:adenosine deaminase [Candidatus Sulfotelmatobacter sp.]